MAKKEGDGLPIPESPEGFNGAYMAYFDMGGARNVDKYRGFLIILLLLVAIIGMIVAFNKLLPLKTVQPYLLASNSASKPVADLSAFKVYTPEKADIEKSLRYWSKNLYTILGYKQALSGVEESRQLLTGQALSQFTEWFAKEEPTVKAHENQFLTRTVEVASLAILPDNVAHIRIVTTTRSSDDAQPVIEKLFITVRYVYIRPETEEDVQKSANGVYINYFNVEPDRA